MLADYDPKVEIKDKSSYSALLSEFLGTSTIVMSRMLSQ
jgi:hypothetical protein